MKEVKCKHINHKHQCYGENIYSKVGNEKRMNLLDMVKLQGKTLKDAAQVLDINYSTAKTILRVYRIENRILKKTPYQKKPKKQIFMTGRVKRENIVVNTCESTPDKQKIISPERTENISKLSMKGSSISERDSGNNYPSIRPKDTPNNFELNSNQNLKNFELVKLNENVLIKQFQSIYSNYQICMKEVVSNEIVIKKLCYFVKNMKAYSDTVSHQDIFVHKPIPIHYNNLPVPQLKLQTQFKLE